MDPEDQLRKFLQTTGWSCDDLMKKIEKLKTNDKSNSDLQPTEKSEECVADSTQQIQETNSHQKTFVKEIDKHVFRNAFKVKMSDDFSDTDEDEAEVLVTNSNIIEEIIEDIFSDNERSTTPVKSNPKSVSAPVNLASESEEVSEIKIIELDADDDDDKFEDECHGMGRLTPDKMEELEKLSRELSCNENMTEETQIAVNSICVDEIDDKKQHCEQRTESQVKVSSEAEKINSVRPEPNRTIEESNEKQQDEVADDETPVTSTNEVEAAVNQTENVLKEIATEPDTSDSTQVVIEKDDLCLSDDIFEEDSTEPLEGLHLKNEQDKSKLKANEGVLSEIVSSTEKNLIQISDHFKMQSSENRSSVSTSETEDGKHDVTEPNVGKESEQALSEGEQPFAEVANNDTPKVYEDIRNNLRMQLSSLRTKKKGSFLSSFSINRASIVEDFNKSKTVESATNLESRSVDNSTVTNEACNEGLCMLKSSTDSNNLETTKNPIIDSEIKKSTAEEQLKQTEEQCLDNSQGSSDSKTDEELYTQTNELGIVISSVQGGIDIDETLDTTEHENLTKTGDAFVERNSSSGVFAEIRKIIKKQRYSNMSYTSGTTPQTSKFQSSTRVSESKAIERNSSFISSADNSQSSFNLEDSTQNSENYSPFVSNTLDEFLTENAKLNISYNVPKCGAEEGLKERYEERPLVLKKTVIIKSSPEGQPKTLQKIKAKTLAQKRKLLERQRKLELKQHEKLTEKNKKIVKKEERDFVMYEGKKISIKTESASQRCLAVIDSLKQSHVNTAKRKLSLLASKQTKIKYLPGPLCKKPRLQLSGKENWAVMTKNLPKLYLEITPSWAKPLPPNIIHHLPTHDGSLSSEHLEFALSVVKSNSDTKQSDTFKFPIKYWNNQELIIVRKKIIRPLRQRPSRNRCQSPESAESSMKAVKSVIDGLLDYIEIKEIAPTLLKDDPTVPQNEPEIGKDFKTTCDNVAVAKKRKKSRFDMELKRLSCKIVNVESEEKDDSNCTKAFCKLGCVCKSLRCDTVMSLHCQKYQCMFNCRCPKEKAVVVDRKLISQEETDMLSKEAVDRIEDEAKKHLAKVEREFTQTVIHTNDKTIVVGLATRHKTRRNTKTPLKYSDFVDSDSVGEADGKNNPEAAITKSCEVYLEKLDLPQIVPFCLVHYVHNCLCKGREIFVKDVVVDKWGQKQSESTVPNKKQKRIRNEPPATATTVSKISPKVSEIAPEVSKTAPKGSKAAPEKSKTTLEVLNSNERPIRVRKQKVSEHFDYSNNTKDTDPMDCARLRGVGVKYFRKQGVDHSVCQNDFVHNVSESELFRYKIFQKDNAYTECDILKRQIITELLNSRNAAKKVNRAKTTQKKGSVKPIFDGEIVIDLTNMELLKRMGPRHVADGFARLLPWSSLLEGFQKGDVKIWCMKDQTSKLMMNKAEYDNPPKNYVDIRQAEENTMIIRCILNNTTPPDYVNEHVFVILRKSKSNFEICGMCTKNDKPSEDVETSFAHRDMNGVQRVLRMRKQNFQLQELIEENVKEFDKTKLYCLPEIYSVCKWRLIYLHSDFTYLFFKKINYSIKYTDLVHAASKAKETGNTVMLRNDEIQNYYDHKVFGIYFDPHYQDRLFLGPYFKSGNVDDVQTLRYINGTLTCSESFSKMRGEGHHGCGHWLIERRYKSGGVYTTTIDLTNEKENENTASNPSSDHVFIHNNQEVKIINTTPKSPAEFNRYIITNIPHFGYLGAYQHPTSEIDIQWPFEKKLLRFRETKNAVDFLQKRLSTLLIAVPQTFKISVLLLTSIDFNTIPPIKADVLNGYHICGDFGYYNISSLTEENCLEKTGYSKDQILRSFALKTHALVADRAKKLAALMKMPETTTVQEITREAAKIIKQLHEKNKQLVNLKSKLLLEKKAKASTAFSMISQLSPEEKYKESKRLMSIMNTTQPIEIEDSDEEKETTPPKKRKTAQGTSVAVSTSLPKVNSQKSLLKPLVRLPLRPGRSVLVRGDSNAAKYIQGVKLVRNPSGNLILIPDSSATKKSPLSPGTKVMIRNNKIQAISKLEAEGQSEVTGDNVKTMEPRSLLKTFNVSEDSANTSSVESSRIIDLCSEQVSDETCSDGVQKNETDPLATVTVCDVGKR